MWSIILIGLPHNICNVKITLHRNTECFVNFTEDLDDAVRLGISLWMCYRPRIHINNKLYNGWNRSVLHLSCLKTCLCWIKWTLMNMFEILCVLKWWKGKHWPISYCNFFSFFVSCLICDGQYNGILQTNPSVSYS